MKPLLEWIKAHDVVLAWSGGLGLLIFLGSIVAIPLIIAYMPDDYFVRIDHSPIRRSPLRQFGHILKNILGAILLVSGFIMLLLPGQGILTMVIGLSLLDFPGKHRLQVRLVRLRQVRLTIAWIRRKAGRRPLRIPARTAVRA